MGCRNNMGQQPVKIPKRDVIVCLRLTDIAAAIDVGHASNNAKGVRHMFAQRVIFNINEEQRKPRVYQQLVIDR